MKELELVIKLSLADKETLGTIRTYPHLHVAVEEEWIWLRGMEAKSQVNLKIRQLPVRDTFEMDKQENLFPAGGLTPEGKMKSLKWIPIGQFITPGLPTSAMPGKLGQKYRVKLVPSDKVKEGQALLTKLSLWKNYAASAPEVRLKGLRFAFSETKGVLILGTPLPAIPGKEYWFQDNMLLPGGFDFEISLISGLIAGKLNPLNDCVILFEEDSRWEKVNKDSFVPATRSAVRLTKGEERA